MYLDPEIALLGPQLPFAVAPLASPWATLPLRWSLAWLSARRHGYTPEQSAAYL
jgi:hypothetical protein